MIKKITRKTLFSIVSMGSFSIAVLMKIVFGSGEVNLSKIESAAENIMSGAGLSVPSANADSVPGGIGCGDGGDGCGGDGCSDGSGDGDGDGDGN